MLNRPDNIKKILGKRIDDIFFNTSLYLVLENKVTIIIDPYIDEDNNIKFTLRITEYSKQFTKELPPCTSSLQC